MQDFYLMFDHFLVDTKVKLQKSKHVYGKTDTSEYLRIICMARERYLTHFESSFPFDTPWKSRIDQK